MRYRFHSVRLLFGWKTCQSDKIGEYGLGQQVSLVNRAGGVDVSVYGGVFILVFSLLLFPLCREDTVLALLQRKVSPEIGSDGDPALLERCTMAAFNINKRGSHCRQILSSTNSPC